MSLLGKKAERVGLVVIENNMKRLIPFLLLAAMALPVTAAERVYRNNPPKGKTYVYKTVDGVARELEIYFPKVKSKESVPGIILFHGGGWGGGTREMFSYQCNYFASRGLVAATVTYRLATKMEKQDRKDGKSFKRLGIPDAKSAIRWFKQHASELGVDPQRIIAGGGSAGGHISLLATTNPGLNDPQDPQGFDASVAAYVLFNPALSAGDAKDPEIDLMQHVKADFPPAIVFFGSKDNWMKKGWSPAQEKMKSLGIKSVDVRIADGMGHGFFNSQPWADLTLISADRFLKKHGLIKGDPTLDAPKTGEKLVVRP
jgi:acetyl esterase